MLLWLLACSDPGSGRVPGPRPGPEVVPLQVSAHEAVAGLEDLECAAGLSVPLRWLRDGQQVATGAGRVVVAARDVWPGTWVCEATDGSVEPVTVEVVAARHNVLVVLVDDIGIDNLRMYGVDPDGPVTPTLDALAAEGVRFRNAWALPECSPTRAALLTGRYPRRTGVGSVLVPVEDYGLPDDEVTLAELLRDAGYATFLAGKWHLGPAVESTLQQPLQQGFDHYAGSLNNLDLTQSMRGQGLPLGYYLWEKAVDGVFELATTYATIDTTDEALAAAQTLPEPWFVLASYNAGHKPWHVPPPNLVHGGPPASQAEAFDLAIEALDTELGRLLDGLGERRDRTTIVFVADNGTPVQVIEPPVDPWQIKGSFFEGGVRVPMIVAGPHVREQGAVSDAFVSVVDVLPTAAALAGVEPNDGIVRDGASLLPYLAKPNGASVRDVLYAEKFTPNGPGPYREEFRVVRDATHRLAWVDGGEYLARIGPGPLQQSENLLDDGEAALLPEDAAALARLRLALRAQEASLGIEP